MCTKGLVECMGHRWLSCVIEEVPEVGPQINSLACMESSDNKGLTWSAIVGKCFSGDMLTRMKTCYDTKSEDLLRKVVNSAFSHPLEGMALITFACLSPVRHCTIENQGAMGPLRNYQRPADW